MPIGGRSRLGLCPAASIQQSEDGPYRRRVPVQLSQAVTPILDLRRTSTYQHARFYPLTADR